MKKIISLVLVLALVTGILPAAVFAAQGSERLPIEPISVTYINPLYADVLTEADISSTDLERPQYDGDGTTPEYLTSLEDAGAVLREAMKQRQAVCQVYFQIPDFTDASLNEYLYAIDAEAVKHNGVPTEGDYLMWQYAGWEGGAEGYLDGTTAYITYTYDLTYYTTAAQEAEMDTAVETLLGQLALEDESDYDKLLGIYDYICDNVVYDHDNLEDTSYVLKYTAYAALCQGTAVCQGYAVLLYRLALSLGVDCRVVVGTGNGGPHAWNIAKLGSRYYDLDATWDAGEDVYDYFLKCEAEFGDHTRDAEYDTEAFHGAYPMSEKSYVLDDEQSEREVVASGWSGATTWVLTDDGVITFSGTGAMKNYTYKSEMPWYAYADQITAVVIEEGVTSIGSYAFYGMPLVSIQIPQSVTAIGDYAFKNATALDGVVLPSGLSKLGESAFYGCTGLTAIEIPASLWTIKPYTFKNCTALESVTFHEGNLQKISDAAFYGTALTSVVLPDCLDILDVYAFKNCSELASITLGSSLTELREAVFYGTAISTIAIPEGIIKIGPYAFKNCTELTAISLPETLGSIGEASFYACTALEVLDLPDGVSKIGNYAFRKCTALEAVAFGSGLKTIGESSFYGCTGITMLTIPEGVTTIGAYAFKSCTGLIDVSLPSTLATLGDSAFYGCTALAQITIPAGVTTIGAYCFSRCTGLTEITFQGSAPTIGENAFSKVTATVYYPGSDVSWTSDRKQSYGGTISWVSN